MIHLQLCHTIRIIDEEAFIDLVNRYAALFPEDDRPDDLPFEHVRSAAQWLFCGLEIEANPDEEILPPYQPPAPLDFEAEIVCSETAIQLPIDMEDI